ncbi:HutD/Ves family protein [Streptomyces subrutilus]|uniref:HutD-family protein n=1 Tax=Streptomyces subrutilus TaxID=36818 RepID=A0A1E5PM33_9ACTN|nr:HutD family protein [Streptomyces subrutilus]OEJ30631.1 HutD-family protein [Streptomyces subrutilus]
MSGARGPLVVRAAGRTATAWKNGGGVTREIAARPEGAGTGDFAWRVSLAEVAADGPFSAFPGVDRTLTLAEGAGMDLTVAGAHRLVDERFAPQDFAGDEPTHCRLLDGPVVNLNVMYRRDGARVDTAVVRGRLTVDVPAGQTLLIVALSGPVHLEPPEGPALTLARHDAALAEGPFTGRVRTSGPAALVRFG